MTNKLSQEWAIGTVAFKTELKESLAEMVGRESRFELFGTDGAASRELRATIWEEKLQQAAAALGFTAETRLE